MLAAVKLNLELSCARTRIGGICKTRTCEHGTFPSLFFLVNNYRSFKSGPAALKAFIAFPAAGWPFIRLPPNGRQS